MIVERIKKIVKRNQNKLFFSNGNESITYGELWDKSTYYASLLVREGNSPVIIYGNKELYVIISIIACLIANRTYIPVGVCTPLDRLKRIVDMTNSSLIITNKDIDMDVNVCSIEELVKYKDNEVNFCESDYSYMIFTSGSTGEPKGVPITKNNLDNFINWISSIEPICGYEDINVLNQASFSFDLSVADFYYSICNGHSLYSFDGDIKDDYDKLFNILYNNKINMLVVTPTFIKMCLINNDFNKKNYPDLKCIYFCGEVLEKNVVRKLFDRFENIKIINAYGPTEATSAISSIVITREMLDSEEMLPVGDMIHLATNVDIVNDEIVLKGNSVFNGYLNNVIGGYYKEGNTNCYRTGDLGFIKDNKLYCRGRIDNQIKYMGYRIELSDIENNIKKIDGVNDCVVISKYDDNYVVKSIKAFVVTDLDIETIKDRLNKLIPSYMMPKLIVKVDTLPINCNGKVDRKILSDL